MKELIDNIKKHKKEELGWDTTLFEVRLIQQNTKSKYLDISEEFTICVHSFNIIDDNHISINLNNPSDKLLNSFKKLNNISFEVVLADRTGEIFYKEDFNDFKFIGITNHILSYYEYSNQDIVLNFERNIEITE